MHYWFLEQPRPDYNINGGCEGYCIRYHKRSMELLYYGRLDFSRGDNGMRHSIKRTVEGVVLVKLLSSLMLFVSNSSVLSASSWFLGGTLELGYGGRSLWNSYYYKRQSSRNIRSNSSCTKSCRKWRDLTVHNIFLRTHQFLYFRQIEKFLTKICVGKVEWEYFVHT